MFIYSLSIFFTNIQLGTPIELISILLLIFVVLYFSMPLVIPPEERAVAQLSGSTLYQYLLNAWVGQLNLRVVFWPFFIFLNLVLFITDSLARAGNLSVSSWDDIHFILMTPVLIWTVSVWRNSINSESRFWAAGARLMTLTVYFEYLIKLYIRDEYPRIFFVCKDIMLDYGACF